MWPSHGLETVLDDPTAAIGKADGVLVLEDPGDTHLELARPYLEAGVPTFVDKPFALSVEHAQEMIALAQTHNTPLMSSSALRFAREVLEFKAQEKELVGDLRVAVATGPNELVYYGIHAAELFYTVMGPGIAWVRNEYTDEYDIVHVRYTDGRAVTMQIIRSARYGFLLNVYGTEGKAEIAVRDANFFYAEQMRAVVRMIQTRENPIPHAEMLEIIGMLVAARQSGETGERVELSSVL